MMRIGWCAAAALSVTSAGAAIPALSPQEFAYGMAVVAPTAAAAYRVAIPLEVYQHVVHADLGDVRVFNAAQEAVPYELQRPPALPRTTDPESSLPLFPLRGDVRTALDGVRVSIQSQGTAVRVQTDAPPVAVESQPVSAYVMDARALADPVKAITLHWPEGTPEFSGRVRIESSDDLSSWQLVSDNAPVLNLHSSAAALIQSRVELRLTRAKFWRLTWLGNAPAFELASVSADVTPQHDDTERSHLSVTGQAGDEPGEYLFDLGASLPVSRINIELPELNSAAQLQLLSRASPTDPWHEVADAQFYRVQDASSERRNAALVLTSASDRYWLARLVQPSAAFSHVAPRLQAAWDTVDVVFLARGTGPFMLAFGSGSITGSETSLVALLSGVSVKEAQLQAARSLGGVDRLAVPARAVPWKLAILWSVLGLGVLLLGWMAYRLSHELAHPK